jgi:hypothetical protein
MFYLTFVQSVQARATSTARAEMFLHPGLITVNLPVIHVYSRRPENGKIQNVRLRPHVRDSGHRYIFGVITGLVNLFETIKKPFPLEFIWIPNKHIKASFTNNVKPGYDFSLDLRLGVVDDSGSAKSGYYLDFAQCKLQRSSRASGGKVKVTASCNYFRATAR